MRTLYIDIETSPNLVYTWGLYNQNVGLNQIVEPQRVLCAAWSWGDNPKVHFASEWNTLTRRDMLDNIWDALNKADIIVHYNGTSYDLPHLNREFLEQGMQPPSPSTQVDLYRAVKKVFRMPSNKLAYVAQLLELGDEGKLHTDFTLWTGVMDEDPTAQKQMEKYNKEDVRITRELHQQIMAWIPGGPNAGLYDGLYDGPTNAPVCPTCGSFDVEKRGFAYTQASKFQRFVCNVCGRWSRAAMRAGTTRLREVR